MLPSPIEYQSLVVDRPLNRRIKIGMVIVTVAVLTINASLIVMANADRSWGAFAIAIMFGPIANGIILLTSLVCVLVVKKGATAGWMTAYALISSLLPLAAIIVDFRIIARMPLQGC